MCPTFWESDKKKLWLYCDIIYAHRRYFYTNYTYIFAHEIIYVNPVNCMVC